MCQYLGLVASVFGEVMLEFLHGVKNPDRRFVSLKVEPVVVSDDDDASVGGPGAKRRPAASGASAKAESVRKRPAADAASLGLPDPVVEWIKGYDKPRGHWTSKFYKHGRAQAKKAGKSVECQAIYGQLFIAKAGEVYDRCMK